MSVAHARRDHEGLDEVDRLPPFLPSYHLPFTDSGRVVVLSPQTKQTDFRAAQKITRHLVPGITVGLLSLLL